jgi:hypothetical protein
MESLIGGTPSSVSELEAEARLVFEQPVPPVIWDHWAAWVLLAKIQLRRGCKGEAREKPRDS